MARRTAEAALLTVVLALAGCASPAVAVPAAPSDAPERMIRPIETVARASLLPGEPGLARSVTVEISLHPKDPVELQILGRRPEGQLGSDGLLEVTYRWKDFVGTEPTSFGGSRRTAVAFGADGQATREQPFVRRWSFELPAPDARVLARRVSLTPKLHPVDLLTEEARTAGQTVALAGVSLDSFREPGDDPLPAALGEALDDPQTSAADVFLLAVGASLPRRDVQVLVAAAVEQLERAEGAHREALFGALQFLTGQVQGHSAARWRLWWTRRQAAIEEPS